MYRNIPLHSRETVTLFQNMNWIAKCVDLQAYVYGERVLGQGQEEARQECPQLSST